MPERKRKRMPEKEGLPETAAMPEENTEQVGPEYLTKEQAAELLGVTTRTIERLISQGKLTLHKSVLGTGRGGRRLFFDRKEVEAIKAKIIRPK